ncbi:T9SS-dependent choice-of-anchor J family protein [Nibribacter koreensis]|uniref:Por secretion system C-terminal sorting domain-containing protein n=1 Tax=Nibribacter koreensis TaxID=1084519 RepID=A0ABP8FVS5_9BACT
MLKNLLFSVCLLGMTVGASFAQSRACATMEYVQLLEKNRPGLRAQLKQQARNVNRIDYKQLDGKPVLGQVVTIPVVVHVLYNTNSQNISEAQIQSQLDVLNKDFRRLNADANKTPALFQGVAADAEIEFCLAKQDPNGEPTNGITRTATTVKQFSGLSDSMKFDGLGGKSAWDSKKYLNIWVVNFSNDANILGFAQFPNSGPASTDGVVIDYQAFGTTGTALNPYRLGRTTTHEVGHWLNLFHIWGDESCGDDEVLDTPTQEEENTGCPIFPKASCSNTSDMFMNYMDYTNDVCMNLFTTGQKNVMQAVLNSSRSGLLSSIGCVVPQVPALDGALIGFKAPSDIVCNNSVAPVVYLRNCGSSALTNVQLQYKIDNGVAQNFTWTGNLASFTTQEISLPSQSVAAGAHTLTVTILSSNGQTTDGNSSNNTVTVNFQVQGNALPLLESFEDATFPPAGWRINNPQEDLTWQRTTKAAFTGSASAFMQNIEYPENGPIDELVLPAMDLTSRAAPRLTFQLAYALLSKTGYSDTLEVLVSTDCGNTYQRVYKKFGQALTTVTPYYMEDEFVPNGTSKWRLETVDLSAFSNAKTAIIKFKHTTDFENNLYLDDVKVDGNALGTAEEIALQSVQIAPNPTTELVQITSSEVAISSVQVLDALGKELQTINVSRTAKGQPLQVNLGGLPNGLYLLKVTSEKGVTVRRVVLSK